MAFVDGRTDRLTRLKKVEDVVVFLRHVHLWLHQVEEDAGRHDGAAVHHRVVRLIWNTNGD